MQLPRLRWGCRGGSMRRARVLGTAAAAAVAVAVARGDVVILSPAGIRRTLPHARTHARTTPPPPPPRARAGWVLLLSRRTGWVLRRYAHLWRHRCHPVRPGVVLNPLKFEDMVERLEGAKGA